MIPENIKKLLSSNCVDDIRIGFELYKKEIFDIDSEFTYFCEANVKEEVMEEYMNVIYQLDYVSNFSISWRE